MTALSSQIAAAFPNAGMPEHPTPYQLVNSKKAYSVSRHAMIAGAVAAAARRNSVILEPWSKAPTYAAATAYPAGAIVRGSGANSANLYMIGKAGTSGAASPPAGTGTQYMLDNDTGWIYIGKGNASSTYPLMSTVTPAGAGDVMDGFVAFPATGSAAALGLTNSYTMNYVNPPVRVSGGNALLNDSGYVDVQGPLTGTLANMARAGSAKRSMLHFLTDSRKWVFIQQAGPLYAGRRYIEVDGRALSEGDLVNNVTINPSGILLNMAAFGPGVHEVKMRRSGRPLDMALYISVADDEHVWPAPAVGPRISFDGDSITQGGGFGADSSTLWLNRLVADQIGAADDYVNAIGGTGAMATANGNATTYIQRLFDVVAFNPDIHVIGGGHNDSDKGTSAERKAKFLEYLRAVRAALPHTLIVLTGNQMLSGDSQTSTVEPSQLNTENDIAAAFAEFNDANSEFIPLLTAPQRFPNSTGNNNWQFQYSGPSPFNDSHPCPRYYPAIAARIVASIRKFYGVM